MAEESNQYITDRRGRARLGAERDTKSRLMPPPSYAPTADEHGVMRTNPTARSSPVSANQGGFGGGLTPEDEWRRMFPRREAPRSGVPNSGTSGTPPRREGATPEDVRRAVQAAPGQDLSFQTPYGPISVRYAKKPQPATPSSGMGMGDLKAAERNLAAPSATPPAAPAPRQPTPWAARMLGRAVLPHGAGAAADLVMGPGGDWLARGAGKAARSLAEKGRRTATWLADRSKEFLDGAGRAGRDFLRGYNE